MLKKINQWIKTRNDNYFNFLKLLKKYDDNFILPYQQRKNMSSFVLPFIMKNFDKKQKLEKILNSNGIESRPFIAGNLLKQPFLKKYNKKSYKNSDFIDKYCFYIGNNQFVGKTRLQRLSLIFKKFFR